MDIIKKLNDMRLERDMSIYRLAELADLPYSTLANTFSRGTVPSISNLEAMCGAMGVSLAQFFGENESEQYLTEDELSLVINYRKLSPSMKKALTDIARSCPKIN